jgi:hypothetical protein
MGILRKGLKLPPKQQTPLATKNTLCGRPY